MRINTMLLFAPIATMLACTQCKSATDKPEKQEKMRPPHREAGRPILVNNWPQSGTGYGTWMEVDDNDNVYVAGKFKAVFRAGSYRIPAKGFYDFFIAKYSAAGDVLWVASAGGKGDDAVESITLDKQGNCYLAGFFVGKIKIGDTVLKSSGKTNAFIAKISSEGVFLWAVALDGPAVSLFKSIDIDPNGNVYAIGAFSNRAFIGRDAIRANGDFDIVIAKFSGSGRTIWIRSFGGTGSDAGYGIAVDSAGYSYITGTYSASAAFGRHVLKSRGQVDFFVSMLDETGRAKWATSGGSEGIDEGDDILVEKSQADRQLHRILVTGTIGKDAVISGLKLTALGEHDAFVAEFDDSGGLVWAKPIGGACSGVVERGQSVTLNAAGQIYMTGRFAGKIQLKNREVGEDCLDRVMVFAVDRAGISLGRMLGTEANGSGNRVAFTRSGGFHVLATYNHRHWSAVGKPSIFKFVLGKYSTRQRLE